MGTYWYLPPEAFSEKNPFVSEKVDIWSTGVILFEMLVGRKPFGHNKSQSSIMHQGIILEANRVEFPDDAQLSEHAKSLIRHCLAYDPRDRFTPQQALAHQFFK
jgi:tousled-like kinase